MKKGKNRSIAYIHLNLAGMNERRKEIDEFTIRVYGIWINNEKQVLVSDEIIDGLKVTKFPGGGLEFGEGPAECVIREWMEELKTPIRIHSQYYFTDDFVPSFRMDGKQVISLYYRVEPVESLNVSVKRLTFDFDSGENSSQSFRFIPLSSIGPNDFTFPIDKKVGQMLQKLTL